MSSPGDKKSVPTAWGEGREGKEGKCRRDAKIFAKDFPFADFNVAGHLGFTNAEVKVSHAFSVLGLRTGVGIGREGAVFRPAELKTAGWGL